jgi:hypothetical protein
VKNRFQTFAFKCNVYRYIKLKKDYMEGCGDSLDLVPIGAFHGGAPKQVQSA